MPWVTINLKEGRSKTMKKQLHKSVAKAVAKSLKVPIGIVHVQLIEMPSDNHTLGGK